MFFSEQTLPKQDIAAFLEGSCSLIKTMATITWEPY
jgi:hypothetical protein